MKKKAANRLMILLTILAVICIVVGLIVMNLGKKDKPNQDSNKEPTTTVTPDNSNGSIDQTQTLNIEESWIQELYSGVQSNLFQVSSNKEDYLDYYYRQDSLLASELPAEVKTDITLKSLNIKDQYENPTIDEEVFNDKYKTLFGADSEVQFTELTGCPGLTKIEQGKLQLMNQCETKTVETTQHQLIKAEQEQDNVYLYEVVAFHKFIGEGTTKTNIYSDYQKTKLVLENIEVGEDPTTYAGLLENQDKFSQYKYTFHSNGDGTYAFQSVEKVK